RVRRADRSGDAEMGRGDQGGGHQDRVRPYRAATRPAHFVGASVVQGEGGASGRMRWKILSVRLSWIMAARNSSTPTTAATLRRTGNTCASAKPTPIDRESPKEFRMLSPE